MPVIKARTDEGSELPVIDITDPRFTLRDGPDDVSALIDAYLAAERRNRLRPTRIMMRLAARRSLLVKSLLYPEAEFLDGLSTYVLKLGPDNLPAPFDTDIDRRLAATPHVTAVRLRLQQVAKMAAGELAPMLRAAPGAPLHLLNIGGGPAIDSINTLIVLRRDAPAILDRSVTIEVLDTDEAGPSFGANALKALRSKGGPLANIDVTYTHTAFDWNAARGLRDIVGAAAAGDAVVAASSEGALFEYGPDEAVASCLSALRAGGRGARFIVGSVTRIDAVRRRAAAMPKFKLVPRSTEAFAALAARSGFRVARTEPGPLSDQVLLRPEPCAFSGRF